MQYTAKLAVTGAWKGIAKEKIYKELGWYRRLVLFSKLFLDSPFQLFGFSSACNTLANIR